MAYKLCFQIQLAPLQPGGRSPSIRGRRRDTRPLQRAGDDLHGEAVRVDPVKPTLNAPGPKQLKAKYD
jgi:hypothetical protein